MIGRAHVTCALGLALAGCGGPGGAIDASVRDGAAPLGCDVQEISATLSETWVRCASGRLAWWGSQRFVAGGPDTTTPPRYAAGIDDAVEISGGTNHVCARRATGAVACFGAGDVGQLGDGTGLFRGPDAAPSVVEGLTDAIEIDAGLDHTCALRRSGSVVCWGDNLSGELGDGTEIARPTPVAVRGLTDAVEISVGQYHACARRTSGTIVCWGRNLYGELGDGTTTDSSVPVQVAGLSDALEVSARHAAHTCARHASGGVTCWGSNFEGELGGASASGARVEVDGVSGVAHLSTADGHTCALLGDGSVSCWGRDREGELGDGSTAMRATPGAVHDLAGIVAIATGWAHTCALGADRRVACWGENGRGQLGDGTTANQLVPVPVVGL